MTTIAANNLILRNRQDADAPALYQTCQDEALRKSGVTDHFRQCLNNHFRLFQHIIQLQFYYILVRSCPLPAIRRHLLLPGGSMQKSPEGDQTV